MALETQDYQTDPVEVKGVKVDSNNASDIAVWCAGRATPDGIRIPTLEGILLAGLGEYVVRDAKTGTFYVMTAEDFEAKYNLVEAEYFAPDPE